MSLTQYINYTIVSFQRSLLFINNNDEKTWKFDLQDEYCLLPEVPKVYLSESEDDEDAKNKDNQPALKTDENIQNITVSESRSLLCLTTGDKSLYLFKIDEENQSLALCSRRRIVRNSSAIIFSGNAADFILLSDKNGDCYVFSTLEPEKPGKWILGHMSQILDVLLTEDQKYVISCDRDEKIRVTNYPNTHDIQSFCHGHEEFVSAIEFLPNSANEILVSISGDKTLRFWNYVYGNEIKTVALTHSATKMVLKRVDENTTLLVIAFYQADFVSIYEIQNSDKHSVSVNLRRKVKEEHSVVSMLCDENQHLYMSIVNDNNELEIIRHNLVDVTDDIAQIAPAMKLNETLRKHFDNIKFNYIDKTHLLFKKKYDNISEYHERKRRRMENKK